MMRRLQKARIVGKAEGNYGDWTGRIAATDCDGCCLVAVAHAEFGVNLLGVGLHGARADEERRGDLFVGSSRDEETQHLALTAGQPQVVRGA